MNIFTTLFNKLIRGHLDILILRIGLGLVFLYAGTASLQDPMSWVGFVPQFVSYLMPRETFLMFHAIFELALGVGLIVGIWTNILSVFAFFALVGILVFFGIDDITFRDFGLAALALALFVRVIYPAGKN